MAPRCKLIVKIKLSVERNLQNEHISTCLYRPCSCIGGGSFLKFVSQVILIFAINEHFVSPRLVGLR